MDTARFLQHRQTRSHDEYLLSGTASWERPDELNEYKLCWILSNGANNECMSAGMLSSQDLEAGRQPIRPGFLAHPERNPGSLPQIKKHVGKQHKQVFFKMRPNLEL